jgi:hypothetical protein
MRNEQEKDVKKYEVVIISEKASKVTQGGSGPIAEYFRGLGSGASFYG